MTTEPANKTSIPRIRSVTFKNGGATIRVLNPQVDKRRTHVEKCIRDVLDSHTQSGHDVAGFAFVVWNTNGCGDSDYSNIESHVPTALIPDYVRAQLIMKMTDVVVGNNHGPDYVNG